MYLEALTGSHIDTSCSTKVTTVKKLIVLLLLLITSPINAMELRIENVSTKNFRVSWDDVGTSYLAYVSDQRRVLTKDLYSTYNGRNFMTMPFPLSDKLYDVYIVAFYGSVTTAVSNDVTVTVREDGMSYYDILDTYNSKAFVYSNTYDVGTCLTTTPIANADLYIQDIRISDPEASLAVMEDGNTLCFMSQRILPPTSPLRIKEGALFSIFCVKKGTDSVLNLGLKYFTIY